MKQINYNHGADLSLEAQIKHEETAESPCSMGALIQLGKSRFPQEFRLIDLPESAHNFRGFFTSAVLRRNNSAQVGVTDRVKAIQHLQGMWYREPICTERESNKGYICSYGIA